ncbi:hypothetical protein ACFY2H_41240 [Streptomyces griseofuscus]|uniref:hypothetical protein n=1 Tax=Streptomyces griseofuscus TaxID=146922 RepID=UPI003693EE9A
MTLMTSTWIDTHSLNRFTVILLMVQVAFDAGLAAKPDAWAPGRRADGDAQLSGTRLVGHS